MRYMMLLMLLVGLGACGRKISETRPVRGNITETVFASGSLEPRESYSLCAQTEGYLLRLSLEHGELVKPGQVLAVIDNTQNAVTARSANELYEIAAVNASAEGPVLEQALQNIRVLAERRKHDSLLNDRYARLFEQQSASKVQMENARLAFTTSKGAHISAVEAYRNARQQTRQALVQQRASRDIAAAAGKYNELSAPRGGKVYRKFREAGDYVRRGEVLAIIGHPSQFYVRLQVDENSIGRVKAGQKVLVNLNIRKDTNYMAVITDILPYYDERSQSFICEAEFENPPALLLAGTQLQANIVTGSKSGALLIHRNYLSYRNTVQVKGKGERSVTVGFVSGDWVEVLNGVDEETVIVAEISD